MKRGGGASEEVKKNGEEFHKNEEEEEEEKNEDMIVHYSVHFALFIQHLESQIKYSSKFDPTL